MQSSGKSMTDSSHASTSSSTSSSSESPSQELHLLAPVSPLPDNTATKGNESHPPDEDESASQSQELLLSRVKRGRRSADEVDPASFSSSSSSSAAAGTAAAGSPHVMMAHFSAKSQHTLECRYCRQVFSVGDDSAGLKDHLLYNCKAISKSALSQFVEAEFVKLVY